MTTIWCWSVVGMVVLLVRDVAVTRFATGVIKRTGFSVDWLIFRIASIRSGFGEVIPEIVGS